MTQFLFLFTDSYEAVEFSFFGGSYGGLDNYLLYKLRGIYDLQ